MIESDIEAYIVGVNDMIKATEAKIHYLEDNLKEWKEILNDLHDAKIKNALMQKEITQALEGRKSKRKR